jgi:hypothetical protein
MNAFFLRFLRGILDRKALAIFLPLLIYEFLLVLICAVWMGTIYLGLPGAKTGAVLYSALILMTVLYSWQVWRIATGKSRFSALFHRWWKP